mmetsp:Transcript_16154/g.45002  ORF Transcript_16154/g.45002 Transcript_16154/m.45002 type:complete len:336 (+) Transcript_16154:1906-2913(+)
MMRPGPSRAGHAAASCMHCSRGSSSAFPMVANISSMSCLARAMKGASKTSSQRSICRPTTQSHTPCQFMGVLAAAASAGGSKAVEAPDVFRLGMLARSEPPMLSALAVPPCGCWALPVVVLQPLMAARTAASMQLSCSGVEHKPRRAQLLSWKVCATCSSQAVVAASTCWGGSGPNFSRISLMSSAQAAASMLGPSPVAPSKMRPPAMVSSSAHMVVTSSGCVPSKGDRRNSSPISQMDRWREHATSWNTVVTKSEAAPEAEDSVGPWDHRWCASQARRWPRNSASTCEEPRPSKEAAAERATAASLTSRLGSVCRRCFTLSVIWPLNFSTVGHW